MSINYDDISQRLASLLLQGFCLLTDVCPECGNLLMKSKVGDIVCVKCWIEKSNNCNKHHHSDDHDGSYSHFHGNSFPPVKLFRLDQRKNT